MRQQCLIVEAVGLFSKIFGRKQSNPAPEHGVIIHFQYGKDSLDPLFNLETQLEESLANEDVGEYDGHEIAVDYSDGFLYFYGSNAEHLFKSVKQILESTDFMRGAKVKLRFGPPEDGVKEIELILGEN